MTRNKIITASVGSLVVLAAVLFFTKAGMMKGENVQDKNVVPKAGRGLITGKLMDHGQAVNTGALVMASVAPIPNPPPTLRMSKPPVPTLFSASAGADGTYSIEVDPSAKPYHLRAFYPVMDNAGNTVTYSKAASGMMVDRPGVKVEQNFSWP